MFDKIRPFFTNPPRRQSSPLGAGLSDDDEPAMPAFQQAWKQGATFEDLFGPSPFTLHGSVGRSGADNHRPDVAKVETFLGDAGYYKPLTQDGPDGWHSTNLDSAIRSFQKDKGLKVDGFLKPNGPTLAKIGSLLGGGASPAKTTETAQGVWGGPNNDQPGIPDMPWPPRAPKPPVEVSTGPTIPWPKPKPPVDGPDLPGGDIWEKPQPPTGGQDDLDALIRIMNGGQKPEPDGTPPYRPTPPRLPPITRPHDGGIAHPPATVPDRFPGHTISESGAKEHDDWAKLLVRDSDPSQTARMLKGAIAEYGDQGRADVADLLGRFHKIDPAKAETLRRAVRDATGEDLPFRVAPLGEGFRELTDEEKLARAPKSPFGTAHGADRWAADNMAEVLLGKGDYADAVKRFRTDRDATMPYLAAVHEQMRDKNPMQAMKFATQMREAGLAMVADAPEPPTPPATQPPATNPPETTTPAPTPVPTPPPQPTTEPPATTPAPTPTQGPKVPQTPQGTQQVSSNEDKDQGGAPTIGKISSPVPNPTVRSDEAGDGSFGARRDGGKREHKGVDLGAEAGTQVTSPIKGKVERIGPAYKDPNAYGGEYQAIHIRGEDGRLYTMRYVTPNGEDGTPIVQKGQSVEAGQSIGRVQDRASKDKSGKMKNHVHLEIKGSDGKHVDPEKEVGAKRKKR